LLTYNQLTGGRCKKKKLICISYNELEQLEVRVGELEKLVEELQMAKEQLELQVAQARM
jgi:hypothetical protein